MSPHHPMVRLNRLYVSKFTVDRDLAPPLRAVSPPVRQAVAFNEERNAA